MSGDQFPIGQGPGTNTGHGHVWRRPDGVKARCGGLAMCVDCAKDQARWKPAAAQTMDQALARERVAAVFYILMRDDTVLMDDLVEVIEEHARKVRGEAIFTNKILAAEARRLARRLLVDPEPIVLQEGGGS